ncbi:MAG: triose-phosphate isomerase [Candidatus Nealsonbacteria bacterium]|nr:triose-phosphate isomerase [Candidatus Nealsonbacteria bacterium]
MQLIIANWKNNPKTLARAKSLFLSIRQRAHKLKNIEVVVCPPSLYLPELSVGVSSLKLGGQDCSWKDSVPLTGEIAPSMLKSLGAEYVILGHSERRRYLQETDALINRKIKSALKGGLKVIFCVGDETRNQIRRGLDGIGGAGMVRLAIVYEPLSAISTQKGSPVAPSELRQKKALIQNALKQMFSRAVAQKVRILYGGSVNEKNIKSFLGAAGMDGFLVGQASLNSSRFLRLLRACERG